MLWRREKIVEKTVEVPYIVTDGDSRSRAEKWSDAQYLRNVRDFGRNNVFVTESMHVLEQMRNRADMAATPDELKGINDCIRILKKLIFAPVDAGKLLIAAEQQKNGE